MRVGDLAAHDGHHVGQALGHDALAVLGRLDPRLALHPGMPAHRLEPAGEFLALHGLLEDRGDDGGETPVAAAPQGDVVDQRTLVVPGDSLLQGVDVLDLGGTGVDGHRKAAHEVLAAGLADTAVDLGRETHAVVEAAAPAVVAPVGQRRPELLQQRRIGGHDLDAIESGLLCPPRCCDMALDHFLDLGVGHGVAAVAVEHRGQTRGRPVLGEAVVPVAVGADVVELLDDRGTMAFHFLGDAAKVRNDGIAVVQEVAAHDDGGTVDRHRLDHDHRRAAPGALPVVSQVTIAGDAFLAHVGGVGPEDDPVLQRQMAQGHRREEMGIRRRHGRPACCLRMARSLA